jgi:hypothetical protein
MPLAKTIVLPFKKNTSVKAGGVNLNTDPNLGIKKSDKYYGYEDLVDHASFDITSCDTSKNTLKAVLNVLLEMIPVAEGLCKVKAAQGSFYSLTSITNQITEITKRLEDIADSDAISNEIYSDLFVTFAQLCIRDIGASVKNLSNIICTEVPVARRPAVDKQIREVFFKEIGNIMQSGSMGKKEAIDNILAKHIGK